MCVCVCTYIYICVCVCVCVCVDVCVDVCERESMCVYTLMAENTGDLVVFFCSFASCTVLIPAFNLYGTHCICLINELCVCVFFVFFCFFTFS